MLKNFNDALSILLKIQDDTGCTLRDIAKVIESYEKYTTGQLPEEENQNDN